MNEIVGGTTTVRFLRNLSKLKSIIVLKMRENSDEYACTSSREQSQEHMYLQHGEESPSEQNTNIHKHGEEPPSGQNTYIYKNNKCGKSLTHSAQEISLPGQYVNTFTKIQQETTPHVQHRAFLYPVNVWNTSTKSSQMTLHLINTETLCTYDIM